MLDLLPLTLAQEGAPPPPAAPGSGPGSDPGAAAGPGNGPGPVTGQPGAPSQQMPGPTGGPGGSLMLILLAVMVVMIFFSFRSQSKEKKKREALLATLKRGDRIQTIGGLIGTVVDLRENEVVVKVDEGNNTKAVFARSAVQNVLKSKEE